MKPLHSIHFLSQRCFLGFLLVIVSARADAPKWVRHAFALPEGIWSVEALDVNADGRLDLVAMGETKVFALTAPDWKSQLLADVQDGKMLYCVALDMDQDGDRDLAIGRYRVPWIEYRQARQEGKEMPTPKGPDFSLAWIENNRRIDAPWTLHVIDRELNGIHGLCVGDVNGDGIQDLISDSIMGPAFPNSLVWFQPNARQEAAGPRRHVITRDGADGRPHYMDFSDINSDGRGDLLLGDSKGGTFTWWESARSYSEPWTKHLIGREDGATNVRAKDVNGDGIVDVVGSCGHGKGVFWFAGPAWERHIIDRDLATPHALALGDFDGDGDSDVAVASFTAFVVRWYENDGRGAFAPHEIEKGNQQQAYDLKACDLNGDGRLDLILAGRESRNAVWYENVH